MQAESVFNTLIDLLNELNWECGVDKSQLFASCVLTGKDFPVPINFSCSKQKGILTLTSPLSYKVAKGAHSRVALAVNLINSVLVDGNFDFNLQNGKIAFRCSLSFIDSVISKRAISHMIKLVLTTVDEYNDKIFTISKGMYGLDSLEEYLKNGV